MKHILQILTVVCFFISLSASCKKDKPELEQLPPATQEGRRTFGCLVNGKAFTAKGPPFGGPILSSYYQLLNTAEAKGYFLNVSARRKNDGNTESISINTESLAIKEGGKYILKPFATKGEAYGRYLVSNISSTGIVSEYLNDNNNTGELYITKLDEAKQVVSGTFWFNAINAKVEKVEVREGRFDMIYTQ